MTKPVHVEDATKEFSSFAPSNSEQAVDMALPGSALARPRFLLGSLVIALIAAGYSIWNAWAIQRLRIAPLDLDGWGFLIGRMQANGRDLSTLFSEPSLWKGPVVPFLFGLCYYLFPFPESVLALNVVLFALAAGCFYFVFRSLGIRHYLAAAAVLLWIFYLPNRTIFGYYFAEPFLAFLVAVLTLLTVRSITTRSYVLAGFVGAVSGLLLLARAPFTIAVGCFFLLIVWKTPGRRFRTLTLLLAGFLVTFLPWTVRNYVVYHEFIPFTIEGGKILFQGVYLHGDDAIMGSQLPEIDKKLEGSLRSLPEFNELEKGEIGKSPIEQYRYWRALAWQQIVHDPLGQMRLCVRKAIRFWVHLPSHSWIPAWKTALVASICLPLAFLAMWYQRRSLLVQLCSVWVLGLWLFHTLVHAELRYNFPVLPMMFMLALIGLFQLGSRLIPKLRNQNEHQCRSCDGLVEAEPLDFVSVSKNVVKHGEIS